MCILRCVINFSSDTANFPHFNRAVEMSVVELNWLFLFRLHVMIAKSSRTQTKRRQVRRIKIQSMTLQAIHSLRMKLIPWRATRLIAGAAAVAVVMAMAEALAANATTLKQLICKNQVSLICHICQRSSDNTQWFYIHFQFQRRFA